MENKNLNLNYLKKLNSKNTMKKYLDSHLFKTIDDKIIFFINNKMIVQEKSKSSFILESLKGEALLVFQQSTNIYYYDDDEMNYKNINSNKPLIDEDEENKITDKVKIKELEHEIEFLNIELEQCQHRNTILNEKMDCRNKTTFKKLMEEEDDIPKKLKKLK